MASLAAERVDYVLIGGLAVNVHGLIRATEDIDLFIRPEAENLHRLRLALARVWADPEIESIRDEDLLGDYPAVRYGPPGDDPPIDLLTRLGDAFQFTDLEAEWIEISGTPIHVATPRTLIRMKRGTIQALDHADARALSRAFGIAVDDA